MNNIRNFAILAHIDHGKSTLADRLLEATGTVEGRKMHAQYLDQMDLEQERGITIKLQPVTMSYKSSQVTKPKSQIINHKSQTPNSGFILNLIDTPGHIDFSYEVSRSLAAVDSVILLVDSSQGVEAQTITNVEMARALGLPVIPVLNKIDLPNARVEESEAELIDLLDIKKEDILKVSAKTGEGVEYLLEEIVKRTPPPRHSETDAPRALIFDFSYSAHRGIIAFVRVFDGVFRKGDELKLSFADEKITAGEVGIFAPDLQAKEEISAGEIGYITTSVKKPEIVRVGDTIISPENPLPPLSGYKEPLPVVFSSFYPASQDEFEDLKVALFKLRLTDGAFYFEQESDAVLGRGFRCGFLGLLHMEIVAERIKREFNIKMIIATPTVSYDVTYKNGKTKSVFSPAEFPDEHELERVEEPWLDFEILAPQSSLGSVVKLLSEYSAEVGSTEVFGKNRLTIKGTMSVRELMRGFFDKLKSVSHGYASFNYHLSGKRKANVQRLDILVAEEKVHAFSRVVAKHQVEYESRRLVEKLRSVLPKELFIVKIQAVSHGRIVASETLSALKKDVTGALYGGDRSRKMKLWQKQKKGKKRLKSTGRVNIPHEVFIKMIRS